MVSVWGRWKNGFPCGEGRRMVFRVGRVEEWFSVWGRWKDGFPCGEGRRMVFRVG